MLLRFVFFVVALVPALSGGLQASPMQGAGIDGQRMTVFEADQAKQQGATWAYRREQLQSPENGGLSAFNAKARISFKTEPRELVAEQRELAFMPSFAGSIQGWRAQDGVFSWQGTAGQGVPLTVPLSAGGWKAPQSLADYDALWVDYTPSPVLNACQPGVRLATLAREYGKPSQQSVKKIWSTARATALKSLHVVDATEAEWKAKDYFYLLDRMLHLAPDANWRYAQDQKNAVVQRRMHVSLANAAMLDIGIAPGLQVERVNMLVRLGDDYGPGELVEFTGLPPGATLPDGRFGVRLNLREALEKRFPDVMAENQRTPGSRPLYLQEVVLFLPGDAQQAAANKPVRNLTLWGEEDATAQPGSRVQFLQSEDQPLNAYSRRMRVDLRKLTERAEVSLDKAALQLQPAQGKGLCALRVDAVRLVSTYDGKAPVYVREVEDWSRRWGGPFKMVGSEQGQLEQPGIVAYLPLDSLTESQPRRVADVGYAFEVAAANKQISILTAPYRVLNEGGVKTGLPRMLASSSGVTLSAQGGMDSVNGRPGVWVFKEGVARLDLHWPINVNLGPETRFYLGVDAGAEQLGSVELTLLTADGQRLVRRVTPNRAVHLVKAPTRLNGLRLVIAPQQLPYQFNLREVALFEPAMTDVAKALRLPLPKFSRLTPKPVAAELEAGVLELMPGHVSGLIGHSGRVQFSTPLATPLRDLRGLSLNYKLPAVYDEGGQCPLMLQFNWTKGRLQRQFCPNVAEDSVFVPLAAWLGEADAGRNLGALQSIDWTVSLPVNHTRDGAEAFSLNFSIEGWADQSVVDKLRHASLFKVGDELVSADPTLFEEALGAAASSRIWLPLNGEAIARVAAEKGDLVPIDNDLFALDQIAVEPVRALDWAQWEKLSNPPARKAESRWPQRLLWLGVFVLAGVSAWKGWWSPGRAWLYAKGGAYLVYWLTAQGLWNLGRWLWRMRPWANLAVGVLALGPGLWLAGRFAGEYIGWMLLALAFLLAWGAYQHWRNRTCYGDEGNGAARLNRLLLVPAFGNAVWALGHFGLTIQALSGALPLVGVGYLMLPRVFLIGQSWEVRFPGLARWLGWSAVTLVLYGFGLVLKVGGGENYFFTFGGMAAVPAMRAALLVLEPWLRRVAPTLALRIFGGEGSLYFSGALVGLLGTALLLSLKVEPVAEQLAIIVYYCLVVGTAKEIIALRRESQVTAEKQSS